MKVPRRRFLSVLGSVFGAGLLGPHPELFALHVPSGSPDERLCLRKFELADRQVLAERPIRAVVVALGSSFLGTPYAAHTLEQPGREQLVINLRKLDCVTFVENTLALARCVRLGQHTFDAYREQLRLIRYRSGVIDGYPSRLHYFTDWIGDNEKKGVVRNVTHELGGTVYQKTISFMSSHRSSYRQLSDETFLRLVRDQEAVLNTRTHFFIPKNSLPSVQEGIHEGDIIAITTSVEGLDISHTGLAVRMNGVLKYLHAPLTDGAVQITPMSLHEYLLARTKSTGIMVARPLEPV